MQLTLWTYEGPPHIGAMRIATAMRDVHYVLHAPQGDTYADLLFTMIERRDHRPPVTYTTFQARDLGGDTATLFKTACQDACPANAITFGNLLDAEKSALGRSKNIERNYDLLNYIGTRPRTSYLARVKNPNPEMPDAKFVGKATIHMV